MRWFLLGLPVVAAMILGWVALAQQGAQSAREMDSYRGGQAFTWPIDEKFKKDVFTFVRLKYYVDGDHGWGRDPEYRWQIDAPDSELNFSYRLPQGRPQSQVAGHYQRGTVQLPVRLHCRARTADLSRGGASNIEALPSQWRIPHVR